MLCVTHIRYVRERDLRSYLHKSNNYKDRWTKFSEWLMFKPSSFKGKISCVNGALPAFLCGTVKCSLATKLSCASPSELDMGTIANAGGSDSVSQDNCFT